MDELRRKTSGGRHNKNPNREASELTEWDDGGGLTGTYVSSDGSIISIDEQLEVILNKDEAKKRRFSKD